MFSFQFGKTTLLLNPAVSAFVFDVLIWWTIILLKSEDQKPEELPPKRVVDGSKDKLRGSGKFNTNKKIKNKISRRKNRNVTIEIDQRGKIRRLYDNYKLLFFSHWRKILLSLLIAILIVSFYRAISSLNKKGVLDSISVLDKFWSYAFIFFMPVGVLIFAVPKFSLAYVLFVYFAAISMYNIAKEEASVDTNSIVKTPCSINIPENKSSKLLEEVQQSINPVFMDFVRREENFDPAKYTLGEEKEVYKVESRKVRKKRKKWVPLEKRTKTYSQLLDEIEAAENRENANSKINEQFKDTNFN